MIQKETNMKYGRYAFFLKLVESSNLRRLEVGGGIDKLLLYYKCKNKH